MPTPITIVTGFLGSGKTTLILNLIPQLPPTYKLALLKNEFGDLAVDSQLASSAAISGVRELLNGCICCNLVGQLGDALDELRRENPELDRVVIETSGSAYPATLALEVNRLGRESGEWVLDGVVSVLDVENWKGYEDTSVTARMQAKYTDLIVLNKWEEAGEQRLEEVLDRIGDLEVDVARVRSERGKVDAGVLLGLDGKLARRMVDEAEAVGMDGGGGNHDGDEHEHNGHSDHQNEVEVLSVTLPSPPELPLEALLPRTRGIDLPALDCFLHAAPKDEIYRIKAVLLTSTIPHLSYAAPVEQTDKDPSAHKQGTGILHRYILNWAFGRWTYTPLTTLAASETVLRMTIITARGEAEKWRRRILERNYIEYEGEQAVDISTGTSKKEEGRRQEPGLQIQRVS